MATATGPVAGVDILFSVDGVPVLCAKSSTLNVTRAQIDATCKQSGGSTESALGAMSWGGSTENVFYVGSDVSWEDFFNLILNKTKFEMSFGTNVTGDKVFRGDAFITNYSVTASDTDMGTFSADFVGTGALTLFTLTEPLPETP